MTVHRKSSEGRNFFVLRPVVLKTLRPSEVVETALRHAPVGVRCELV